MTDPVTAVVVSKWDALVAYVKANHVAVIVGAVLFAAIKRPRQPARGACADPACVSRRY